MILRRMLQAVVICLPLVVLATSFARAPYTASVRNVTGDLPPLPTTPLPLYERDRTRFFYTSADLIHPESVGDPGLVDAVVFDAFPAGQGLDNATLTWTRRFSEAIAPPSGISSDADVTAANAFRQMLGSATATRGTAQVFDVPESATYRHTSGIRAIAALWTRPAPDADERPLETPDNGSPQLFDEALSGAFRALASRGVEGVGVPRMIIRARIGAPGNRSESWEAILAQADTSARAAGIRRILFGGWGIDPRARAQTDSAFRTAWVERRKALADQAHVVADERVRIAALLAFSALLQWTIRGRTVNFLRLLALGVFAAGTALTVAQLAGWFGRAAALSPLAVFGLEALLALAAGAALEAIVQFDPRSILKA